MTLFKDVKDLAGGKRKSKDWYRNQVRFGATPFDGQFTPGKILMFNYGAATPDLPFYDTNPLMIIVKASESNGTFEGGNIHYLRPSRRKDVGDLWYQTATRYYPKRCHHKYFMSNASGIYEFKTSDFEDYVPLPLEQFVLRKPTIGLTMPVPSSVIWSRLT